MSCKVLCQGLVLMNNSLSTIKEACARLAKNGQKWSWTWLGIEILHGQWGGVPCTQ